jgi:YidC/Oxa1 family membrane protein insertase
MADPNKKEIKPLGQDDSGFPLQKNLLVAFALMGLVLFLSQYLYKPAGRQPQDRTPAPAKTETPASVATPSAPPAPAPVAEGRVAASDESAVTIETDLYRIVFSNRGAVVRSWVLKQYKDSAGKPLELVFPAGAAKAGFPFSLDFPNGKAPADFQNALFAATLSDDRLTVEFRYSDGRASAYKSFRFQKDRYLAEIRTSVANAGRGVPHLVTWRGGFGDNTGFNHAAALHSLYFDAASNKLVVESAKLAKNGPVSRSGAFSFAGIEDSYFAAVVLPSGTAPVELRTYSDPVSPAQGASEVAILGAGVGGGGDNRLLAFVGPKDLDILRGVNPKLEQVVDFGWFSIIAKPLFLSLDWVNKKWFHNYGWSIVAVTVIINFLLLPLKFTSLRSMKKMQLLQPQIAAINEKYKGIGLRDPRKAEQNQEVMNLYKKHGVNPMGGCMPMLLQIPFFYAFYKVLTVAIEMRGAEWLWVRDLSQPEHLAIRVLPIAMIVTQFIMQKMTPSTSVDPAQQRMMLMMPLILGFMFYGMSSGLVLYWLTGNVVGIAQQWFFNRLSPAAPIPAAPAKAKGKKAART